MSSDPDPSAEQTTGPTTDPATGSPAEQPPAPRPAAPRPPGPPVKPPRSALTVRDMLMAIGMLLVVVLVVGGVSRSCTFAPGGPTVDSGQLPVVDAPAELRRLAPLVPMALRIPAVPPDWRSNSVEQDVVAGGGRSVRTGYITPAGRYLRLLQSDAGEDALLAVETGTRAVAAQGPIDVDGQAWIVYGGREQSAGTADADASPQGNEPIWIAQVAPPGGSPVRMLITGSGSDDDFRTLAAAARQGELLRRP